MEPFLVVYAVAEITLALLISFSNFVVIVVYISSKHVRTPTNAYIFSLAITDFLAGIIGIPTTVYSVLTRAPAQFLPCLAVNLILCVLCTISTFHLLAIAVDKYLTICCKRCQFLDQHQTSRQTRSKILIFLAWIVGTLIASMPLVDLFGFASSTIRKFRGECHFTVVVDYRYLVYVIFFGTILLPSTVIAYCYAAIYSKIRSEEKQIKCLLRASERQRRMNNRRKLIRIMLILVTTYALCWYPLYMINTYDLFRSMIFTNLPSSHPIFTLMTVVLSHVNCALNPIIYAYGVPGFKHSLRRFLPRFYSKAANTKASLRALRADTSCMGGPTIHNYNNGSPSKRYYLTNLKSNKMVQPDLLSSVPTTPLKNGTPEPDQTSPINNSPSIKNHTNGNGILVHQIPFPNKNNNNKNNAIPNACDFLFKRKFRKFCDDSEYSMCTSSNGTFEDEESEQVARSATVMRKKHIFFQLTKPEKKELGNLKKVSYSGVSLINSIQANI